MPETWTYRLIKAALKIQDRVAPDVPEALKQSASGRKGQLVITGEDGCTVFLRWDGSHLLEDPDDSGTRNVFRLHSQTLQDLIVGELTPREALAARLVEVSGDRAIYDSEDIMRVLAQLTQKMRSTLGKSG